MFKTTIVLLCGASLLVGCQTNHAKPHANSQECCGVTPESSVAPAATTQHAAAAKAQEKPVAVFGGEQKLTAAVAVAVSAVVADPDAYRNKYVRVTGTVSQVCEKKGCWLRVAPSGAAGGEAAALGDIFIKFKDPPAGRLIPLEAVGHDVTVEGTLKKGALSEAAARHFKHDAGAPEAEINKIVGPQPQLFIAGAVVAIEGVAQPAAE